MANQAIGQADEMTAMLQRTVDDSEEQWRDTAVRVLDAARALDDAGLRRKVQRLRDTLARSERSQCAPGALRCTGCGNVWRTKAKAARRSPAQGADISAACRSLNDFPASQRHKLHTGATP